MSFVSRIRSIMQKSVNANSDGYDFAKLKKWAIEHIKKQIKDNSSDDMKKSLECGDFSVCKALSMVEEMQKAVYPVGTIREWKGRKYIKVAPGKWKPKYDSMTRGAKSSLTRILHSLEKCSNDEELYAIISQANARFRDDNGKLLPEAQIIYDNHKTASRGIENGKKIDSLYEKNLKRIKELEKQGKSDDEIDNDEIIKKNKEEMKNIGKEKSDVNKKDIHDVTVDDYSFQKVGGKWLVRDENDGLIGGAKFDSKKDAIEWAKKNILRREFYQDRHKAPEATEKTSENNEVKEKKDKESIRIKWAQEKMRNKGLHKDYDDLAGKIMDIDLAINAIDRKGRSIVGDKEIKDLSADEKNEVYKLGKERSRLNDKMKELVDEQNETKYQMSISDKKIVDLEEEFEDAESNETNLSEKKEQAITDSQMRNDAETKKENNFSRILSDKQLLNSIDRKRNKLSSPGKDVTPIEEELKNVSEKLKNMNNKELNDVFDNFETDYTKYPSIGEFEDELEERLKTFDMVYDRLSNDNKKEELESQKENEQKKKPDFSKMNYSERVDYIRNNPVSSEERKLINHLNDVDNAAKKLTGNETVDDIQKKIDAKQKQLDAVDKKDLTKINKVGWELDELKNMKEAIEKKGNGSSKTYTVKDENGKEMTNEDVKKNIRKNIEGILSYKKGGTKMGEFMIGSLEKKSNKLASMLNPDERKEMESEIKKVMNQKVDVEKDNTPDDDPEGDFARDDEKYEKNNMKKSYTERVKEIKNSIEDLTRY